MSQAHRPSPERRISARLVDSFSFNIGYDGYDVTASVINISSSGLLCRTSREIPTMSKIDMALVLPSRARTMHAEAIKIKGVVVRNDKDERGYRTAIFFIEISATHRKKLEAYVNNLSEGA